MRKSMNRAFVCIFICLDTISGMKAEACRRGASDSDHSNEMLSRVFIGYGKMADHVIYLPNSCHIPRSAPTREEWSMGGDGPSILGPAVYHSKSYEDILCPFDQLSFQVIRKFADELVKNNLLPVSCNDESQSREIAFGIILVAVGYPTEAFIHFNKIIEEDSSCPAVYYGRALSYSKSGLSQHNNAVHALSDLDIALEKVKSDDETLAILERRAEVYQAMGLLQEANADYTKILENENADPNVFMHRGSVLFLLEEYVQANEDFKKSLETTPDQPVAMHYRALCLYNMGKLREAVKLFRDILVIKPDYTEIIQSLGQAYQELGEFDLAIENFNKALSVNPTDARSYHYKGVLQYNHGDPSDALKSFKTCAALEPYNVQCHFMKGASLATLGRFFPAVKEFTKVMLSLPTDPAKPSSEHIRVKYLREWCRYMHSNLESRFDDVSAEADLRSSFREQWVNSLPFDFPNYTEQPGIQPHIKDIDTVSWEDVSAERKELICKGFHIGSLIPMHSTETFMANRRLRTAMGLAAIQISQSVTDHFKTAKDSKLKRDNSFTWRTPFDIAVKWKRLVDANQPIMWLDKLANSKQKPNVFIHHFNLMKGDKYNIMYAKYIDDVVALLKKLVLEFTNAQSSNEYRSELESANDYESVVKAISKHGGISVSDPGFSLGSKVLSVKDRKRKHLDGFMISLASSENENLSVLAIDVATKKARTQQYHAELEYVWDRFLQNMTELHESKNVDTTDIEELVIDSTLSLAYYFYNLMPISEGSGVISYATTLGFFLAIGREVTGKLEPGKIVEMDALLSLSPEKFMEQAKSWMKLERATSSFLKDLPDVKTVLPTLRNCLEAVNIGSMGNCL